MCDLGTTAEFFNPQVLFIWKRTFTDEYVTKVHMHEFSEIRCILDGKAAFRSNDVLSPIEAGDILMINPGHGHTMLIAPGESCSEMVIAVDRFTLKGRRKNAILAEDAPFCLKPNRFSPQIRRCVRDIQFEYGRNLPGNDLVLKSLVMQLMALLLREMDDASSDTPTPALVPSTDRDEIVLCVMDYLKNHFSEDIKLERLARHIHLSPVYLSKIFKDATGDSPIHSLITIRMERAAELLLDDALTIKSVANMVGYPDALYFSRLFRKHFGVSPNQFRDQKSV